MPLDNETLAAAAAQGGPTELVDPDSLIEEIYGDDSIRDRLGVIAPEDFEFINEFIYGESGVGKTHYLGTAGEHEDTSPMLIIDCEGGTKTLRGFKNIDVKPARTVKDLENIHNDLFKYNNGWYKSVAIDNLTEVQDIDMNQIMKETKENARNPDNVDIDVPSPREYGKGRKHIRIIVRAYRDLPVHTFVVCLSQEIQEEENKPTRFRPALPGKLQGEIPSFMDIVGYMHKDGAGTRKMQLDGTRRVIAKTRFRELGGMLIEPNIPDIFDKLTEEKNRAIAEKAQRQLAATT